MFFRKIYFLPLIIALTASLQAQECIRLDPASQEYRIGKQIGIYEDKSANLAEKEVMAEAFDYNFIQSKKEHPGYGYSKSVFWVKFQLLNADSQTQPWILWLAKTSIDDLRIYIQAAGKDTKEYYLGRQKPFSQRPIRHQNFMIPMTFAPGEQLQVYMRLQSSETISIPLSIISPQRMNESNHIYRFYWGIMYGLIIVMIFYNGFLFISLRDKSYLLYVIYITCSLLLQLSMTGDAFENLWPQYPWWNAHAIPFFAMLSIISATFFTREFLKTKLLLPVYDRLFMVVIGLAAILVVLTFTLDYSRISTYINVLPLGFAILVITTAIMALFKGYRPARFFLISWLMVITGIVTVILRNTGIIPETFITQNGVTLGTILELVLLSFALADRIMIIREEKDLATQELKKAHEKLENYSHDLEQEVNKRTKELKEANKQLLIKNSELQLANELIEKQEAIFIQKQKLSTFADIVSGVAHEMNTPILAISVGLNSIKRAVAGNKKMREVLDDHIEMLIQSINHIRQHIDNLRSFIKLKSGLKNKFNINNELNTTLNIINFRVPSNVKINTNLEDIPDIYGNAPELNQAFMNILTNALDAIPSNKNGIIQISTRLDDGYIEIKIQDNGTGIESDILRRIFSDKVSTKQEAGSGLGLILAKEAITNHNGKIHIDSRVREGAEVLIRIPVAQTVL